MNNPRASRNAYAGVHRFKPDGAGILAACRTIKTEGSYAKINGVMVDTFTASAIVAVHDALNEENRAKLLALPLQKIASICFRLLK